MAHEDRRHRLDPEKLIALSIDVRRLAEEISAPSGRPFVKASDVRYAIRVRRERDKHFDSKLFADPAWDMLLDLFAAHLEGKNVSVSSLCVAASVPPTTAYRWVDVLSSKGLIVRHSDSRDGRRVNVALTDESIRALTSYFQTIL
jgi:hypothetical protein